MSRAGAAPQAPARRRRREPLRAAPAPDGPVDRPVTDPAPARHVPPRSRRRGPVAAIVLVVAVAALVLVAARAPGLSDAATVPEFDLVRTETSAPHITVAAAGGAVEAASAPAVALGSIGDVVVATDGVPSTGGYTDLIRSYFGPLTVEAIVIVQCESGFDPSAVGENTNGTRDHGLFQINDVHEKTFEAVTGHPWTDVYDPTLNTSFAAWLHDHAGGWGPWRCNRNLEQFDLAPGDGTSTAGE